jgi:hypothetical protein
MHIHITQMRGFELAQTAIRTHAADPYVVANAYRMAANLCLTGFCELFPGITANFFCISQR